MSKVLLPAVNSFHDLFEVAVQDKSNAPEPVVWSFRDSMTGESGKVEIGPYLQFQHCIEGEPYRNSLWVRASPIVIDTIKQHMLPLLRDSITFKVCVYADGTALVVAQNNLILGSRWLAYVDASTVPDTRDND